jgi:hypothetical protein
MFPFGDPTPGHSSFSEPHLSYFGPTPPSGPPANDRFDMDKGPNLQRLRIYSRGLTDLSSATTPVVQFSYNPLKDGLCRPLIVLIFHLVFLTWW